MILKDQPVSRIKSSFICYCATVYHRTQRTTLD